MSSPRWRPPASPSAARPGPTTSSPRQPWRTAKKRATSSDRRSRPERPRAKTRPERPRAETRPARPGAGDAVSELVRFSTAGSVDDGKSTMIGRLLYDTKALFDDHLEAVERSSQRLGLAETNLALVTDGLRAEREQGITIDVAYRYFATPKRKFIIADTPGHVQYTRNMVTGASTA